MSTHDWHEVEELLHQAMALAPEQRAAYLDAACGSDADLRAELNSLLLVGDDLSDEFLSSPLRGALDRQIGEIDSAAVLAVGQIFAQRFELIRKLGEGGMGQVWLAEQVAPVRRQVALKLIKAGMYDEAVVQRFQSERQSLAMMDHPAIAKVFDAGTTSQGQPYLVMEFVPGLPITDYCDQHKLSIKDRLEIFIQACEGVQHAHQKAIIHRDLKPSNILVIEVDGKAVPRIIDFGLAKTTAPQVGDKSLFTQFGQFIGTPGYMSPEQVSLSARDIDTRTDVYTLGVVLYVLLTGLQPFETKRREKPSLEEWLRQLREEEPPNPSTKVSGDKNTSGATADARRTEPKRLIGQLRGDLDWITMKALDRERERRYATPSDLAADLRRYLNDEAVMARPASARYQLRKFVRRHRIAAAFLGMTTVLTVISSSAALVAVRQKHEAEFQAAQALQAQSRLLIQAAAARLKSADVAAAQSIILEVLTNPAFAQARTPAAISVFQDVRAADAQLAVLSVNSQGINFAAYSPDGSRLVTASSDNTARVWDARTGAQLAVLTGHGSMVYCAAYSPDGTRIVTASADKTARIWDSVSAKQLAVLSGHDDGVNCAAYAPDGDHIVTASSDKTARIWDAHTGNQLEMLSGHEALVRRAAYSPDSSRVVSASYDKTARIWDAHTAAVIGVLTGHADRVASAAFSPDGNTIVTASDDRTARIWDARTQKQLFMLSGHLDRVAFAAYSPGGSQIVTASNDKTARIWDAQTGKPLAVLSGHGQLVYSAQYSPDGTRIVSSSRDKTARVWEAHPHSQLAELSGPGARLFSVAYSPDGTRILTASQDRTARIRDALTGRQLVVLSGHTASVEFAAYSPDGTRVVTASLDKTARIWDSSTGSELAVLAGHTDRVWSASYSPDGLRIVTASIDKTARVWDARTATQVSVLSGHTDRVLSAAYSHDGTRIVTASVDKTARIWDARTGALLVILAGHGEYVTAAAYSPDDSRIVTGSFDKTARIWDAQSGAQLAVLLGHADGLTDVAYSPDGRTIVTTSLDTSARLWDARTGVQLGALSGPDDASGCASFSPDGTRVITAADNGTLRIWDAHAPADISAQIVWAAAAETDPLLEIDRAELGLPHDPRVRIWSDEGTACDQAAAALYDPDRLAPGTLRENIASDIAAPACRADVSKPRHEARTDYQMGRSLFAKGDTDGARRRLEAAVNEGYRAASIDLADLMLNAPAKMLDIGRARSLYEKAWQDGISIAAFRLGTLHETSLESTAATEAWRWYQKGADSGEPYALARFAERDERNSLAEADPSKRNALLLQSFTHYAAAALHARDQGWPDETWRIWRYRRATLARVLAREGMMQQVADAYSKVLEQRNGSFL
jgi:eukaryotic-like serine/threonine-protein kinase